MKSSQYKAGAHLSEVTSEEGQLIYIPLVILQARGADPWADPSKQQHEMRNNGPKGDLINKENTGVKNKNSCKREEDLLETGTGEKIKRVRVTGSRVALNEGVELLREGFSGAETGDGCTGNSGGMLVGSGRRELETGESWQGPGRISRKEGREKQNGVRIKSLGTLRKSFTTRNDRKSVCTILRYYHSNG